MKKSTILAIFAVVAVIGVGIIIKLSQTPSTTQNNTSQEQTTKEETPSTGAGEIGEGEVKIDSTNFKSEVTDYKGIVLVDMYAPNCKYCIMVGPVISEIAKEYQNKYKFGKLDLTTAENKNYSTEYKIEGTPTLIIFKDGKEVDRIVGYKEKDAIVAILKKYE